MNQDQRRWIRRIASRAVPLWSRGVAPGAKLTGSTERRLQRWRAVLGGEQLLERRMRAFPAETPASLLARVGWAGNQRWARTLGSVLFDTCPTEAPPDSLPPVPFAEIFDVFLGHARERLRSKAGLSLRVLCAPAMAAFERDLLEHLAFVASLVIGKTFYDFRFQRAPLAAFESWWSALPVSRDLYFAFVQQMRSGGLVEVFDQYPVLARLLAQSVDQWVSAVARFCRRFESDWPRLVKQFDWPHETSDAVIELVKSGLSDRHGGGQTVVEVVLAGGERLIYKPRSVRAEIVFNDLLRWLNERALPLELKTLRGLDRRRYGWMEVGHHGSCRTQAEVERFCIRAGMLLAILHALAVTDIHYENLIACAEHPVVVDLETLLTESPRRPRGSVLDTGFLPSERAGEPDLSALAADPTPRTDLRFPIWRRINTDQMMLEEGAPAETHLHRVRLNGEAVVPTEYLGSIRSGFRMAYTALMEDRRDLLRAELMAAFDGLELRVLLRDSATYGQMHLHMLHPEYLKDGIDRSIELEWLARPLCSRHRPAVGRLRIYQHELNAMEQLDVPRFDTTVWHNMRHARTSSEALLFGGARDSSVLRRRLARLRASGCLVQLAVISRSLLSRCG